jgi:hypothetical protein
MNKFNLIFLLLLKKNFFLNIVCFKIIKIFQNNLYFWLEFTISGSERPENNTNLPHIRNDSLY